MRATLVVFLTLAAGLARTSTAQERTVARVPGVSVRLIERLQKPDDLRVLLRYDGMRTDIRTALADAGWPSGLADDIVRLAADAEITSVQIAANTHIPLMVVREGGRVHAKTNARSGKRPLDAFAFELCSDGKRFRLVAPKMSSGFWLEPLSAPGCFPVQRAATISFRSEPERYAGPGEQLEYELAVENSPSNAQVVLYLDGKEAARGQVRGGIVRLTVASPSVHGAYDVRAVVGDVSTTSRLYVLQPVGSPGEGPTPIAHPTVAATPLPPPPPAYFPWPPPQWTKRAELPMELLLPTADRTYGAALDGIKRALSRAGIEQWSVYGLPEEGFAVVAEMEHIYADGTPLPGPNRWLHNREAPMHGVTFDEIVRVLFRAPEGRYRVIALLVTSQIVTAGGGDPAGVSRLPTIGPSNLPQETRARRFSATNEPRCVALVYEFRKSLAVGAGQSATVAPILSADSGVPCTQHLAKAGLWAEGELR